MFHYFETFESFEEGYHERKPPRIPPIEIIDPRHPPFLPTLEPWFLNMENDTDMINMVEELQIRKLDNPLSDNYATAPLVGKMTLATHQWGSHIAVHMGAKHYNDGKVYELFNDGEVTLNYELRRGSRGESYLSTGPFWGASLSMMLAGCFYVRERTVGGEEMSSFEDVVCVSLEDMTDCISELSNILLLRKLAREGKEQEIDIQCMLINGEICDCTYIVFGPETILFGEKEIEVIKIIREVTWEDKYAASMTTYLTRYGQIVRHHWSDSDIFIIADPRTRFPVEAPFDPCDTIPLRYYFMDYEVTRSFYQDKIGQHITDNNTYLSDNPEIIQTLSSLLQMLMINRPCDPVTYLVKNYRQLYHEK